MVADLKLAIQAQELDRRISELKNEIAALPKHVAVIEKTLDSHLRKLEADRAALAANQRERKGFETDIQTQEQRISKFRDQMLGAKTNEQYGAFKNEIEFCEKEIRKSEDRILEKMAEAEALDKNVKAAETSLDKEKRHVESEKKQARERTAVDQKALDEAQHERRSIASGMSAPVYREYERIRKSRKGIAVTEASDGRCLACNMVLRLQLFQELRLGNRIICCESCGRMLYFNPPVETDEAGPGESPSEPQAQSVDTAS
ncbi:MAG: C4-type zinc ribbon domain-containing protein [Bryobacteraceae bacterium]